MLAYSSDQIGRASSAYTRPLRRLVSVCLWSRDVRVMYTVDIQNSVYRMNVA